MAFVVKEVQPTPNPNALKFILDRVVAEQPISFLSPSAQASHPLAKQLFEISGVISLLFLGDFITINKSPQARWADIRKAVEKVLRNDSSTG